MDDKDAWFAHRRATIPETGHKVSISAAAGFGTRLKYAAVLARLYMRQPRDEKG
jgi:hypothetical protein